MMMNCDQGLSSDDEMARWPANGEVEPIGPSAELGLSADELAGLKAMLMEKARNGNLPAIQLILQLMRTPSVKPPPTDGADFAAVFGNFVKPLNGLTKPPLPPLPAVHGSAGSAAESVDAARRPVIIARHACDLPAHSTATTAAPSENPVGEGNPTTQRIMNQVWCPQCGARIRPTNEGPNACKYCNATIDGNNGDADTSDFGSADDAFADVSAGEDAGDFDATIPHTRISSRHSTPAADNPASDKFEPTIRATSPRAPHRAESDVVAPTAADAPTNANAQISGRRPRRSISAKHHAVAASQGVEPGADSASTAPPVGRDNLAHSAPEALGAKPPKPVPISVRQPRVRADSQAQMPSSSAARLASTVAEQYDVGDVIDGRFEVFGHAAGGMGLVYFVHDRLWRTDLAVKSLRMRPNAPREVVEAGERAFLREALAWLDLRAHPNIVSGYFARNVGGQLRFFMEYVPGGSLRRLLKQRNRLPIETALQYAAQIAQGLIYVHTRTNGRPHRDLKPDNCLVDPRHQSIKITDFGLLKGEAPPDPTAAIGVSSAEESLLSFQLSLSGGNRAGTPPYMPPEQWSDAHKAGIAADVYAFGVMLFEMIVGRRPFEIDEWDLASLRHAAPTLSGAIDAAIDRGMLDPTGPQGYEQRIKFLEIMHTTLPPPDPREFEPSVPAPVADLIATCLRKDPRRRLRDFSAVSSALSAIHRRVVGTPLEIAQTQNLHTVAGENNRALSLMEMGYPEKALPAFDAVLTAEPTALVPFLNGTLIQLSAAATAAADSSDAVVKMARAVHKRFSDAIEPARTAEIAERRAEVERWHEIVAQAARGRMPSQWQSRLVFLPMLSGTELVARERRRHQLLESAKTELAAGEFAVAYEMVRDAQAQLPERKREPEILRLITEISRHGLISDVEDAWLHARLKPHDTAVTAVAVAPTGDWAVSGDRAGKLAVMQLEPTTIGDTLEFAGPIRAIVADSTGLLVALDTGDIVQVPVKITDTDTDSGDGDNSGGRPVFGDPRRVARLKGRPRTMALGANARLIVGGDFSGAFVYRHLKPEMRLSGRDALFAVASTPDGEMVVGASPDAIVEWNCKTNATGPPRRFPAKSTLRAFGLTVDGKFAVTGAEDGTVQIFDYENARPAGTLRGHWASVSAVLPTPEGRQIVTASADQTVRLWSLSTRQPLQQLQAHDVRVLAANPDGRYLFAGTAAGSVYVWQIDWGWSFTSAAVESRQQIAQQASFAFHRQQRIKRRLLVASVATVVAIVCAVIVAVVSAAQMMAVDAANQAQWDDLAARAEATLTPMDTLHLWSEIDTFATTHPEFRPQATALESRLRRRADGFRDYVALKSKASAATTGTASAVLREIDRFAQNYSDWPAEVAELNEARPGLQRLARLAAERAIIAQWPLPHRQFHGYLTHDTHRLRFLDASAPMRDWLVEAGETTAKSALDWPENVWDAAQPLTAPKLAAFAALPAEIRTAMTALSPHDRAEWLDLPPAEIVGGWALSAENRSQFLALPSEARAVVLHLPRRIRDAAMALSAAQIVPLRDLSPEDQQTYLDLPHAVRGAFIELPAALRAEFAALPADQRLTALSLSAAAQSAFIRATPAQRDALMQLPAHRRAALIELPAELRDLGLALSPADLTALVALPAEYYGVVSRLPRGVVEKFLAASNVDRHWCASLPSEWRPMFLDLPDDLRSRFLELPPTQRAEFAALPKEWGTTWIRLPEEWRGRWRELPRDQQAFCAALPADFQADFVGAEPAERTALMALSDDRRQDVFAWSPTDRQIWLRLPPLQRDALLRLPASQRQLIMEYPLDRRADLMALPPSEWELLLRGQPRLVEHGTLGRAVTAAAFSADGRWIVTGSSDRTVRVWPFSAGTIGTTTASTGRHPDTVRDIAISGDSSRTVLVGSPTAIRLARLDENGRLGSATVIGDSRRVSSATFAIAPTGEWAIADSRLFRLSRGRPEMVTALDAEGAGINDVAFAPDGRFFAVAFADATIRTWTLGGADESPRPGAKIATLEPVTKLAMSPRGSLLIAGSRANSNFDAATLTAIWVHDGGASLQRISTVTHEIRGAQLHALTFSPDGRWLAAAFEPGPKIFAVTDDGYVIAAAVVLPVSPFAAFSSDGRWLAMGGKIWQFWAPLQGIPTPQPGAALVAEVPAEFREFVVSATHWHITKSVSIPAGTAAIIPAGTRLTLDPGVQINVSGMFAARGTPSAPIRFAGREWAGFYVNGDRARLIVSHAIIDGATRDYGGAIEMRGGAVGTLSHVTIRDCYAKKQGGAIFLMGVRSASTGLEAEHCTFTENRAADQGGAINFASFSYGTLAHCRFEKNNGSDFGGAIFCRGEVNGTTSVTVTITDGVFAENTAAQGGAIGASYQSQITIRSTAFTANVAQSYGGVIAVRGDPNSAVTVAIDNTEFSRNRAHYGGAIAMANLTALTLVACKFSDNTGTSHGGALYTYSETNDNRAAVSVERSTFERNQSRIGPDAYFGSGTAYDRAALAAGGLSPNRVVFASE